MEHIKTADIISFVTARTLTEEAVENAARVTAHIRSCPRCFGRVKDFQDLADGLFSMALEKGTALREAEDARRDGIGRDAVSREEWD